MARKGKHKPIVDDENTSILNYIGLPNVNASHLNRICITSVITVLTTILLTLILRLPIDTYDLSYFYQHVSAWLIGGSIPYVGTPFDYPPFAFIPMVLAFIPDWLFHTGGWLFILTFITIMVACNIVTTIGVYLIGLKVYEDKKLAYHGALLYATAFAGSYFVITKYDAFPVMLLVLSVTYLMYDKDMLRGYFASSIGFIAKLFPVVAVPFIMLYNRNVLPLFDQFKRFFVAYAACLLVIPVAIMNRDVISNYISSSLLRSGSTYVDTATYTLYTWFNVIIPLGIPFDIVSKIMFAGTILGIITLLYLSWKDKEQTPRTLITYITVATMAGVLCMSYRSPQYILWFLPFLSILVVDRIRAVYVFLALQLIAYLEFPGSFNWLWVNNAYIQPVGTGTGNFAVLMFTVEFALYLVLMYICLKPTSFCGKEMGEPE